MSPTVLAITAGAVAALCFGVGDFVSRSITRSIGWARAFLWVQVLSLIPLLALGSASTGAVALTAGDAVYLVALGLCNALGVVGLYRSFEVGILSVVSPIASTFAVVTVAWALVFGHALGASLLLALGLTLCGVMLVSRERALGRPVAWGRGVGWAALSSLAFGTVFFFLEDVAVRLGPVWPVVGLRVMGAGAAALWLSWRHGERVRPAGVPWGALAAVALLDSGGMVVYAQGTRLGEVAIVAVLASCFSAVTVALAHVRLRERLSPWQRVGLVVLLAGVAWTTWQGAGPTPE